MSGIIEWMTVEGLCHYTNALLLDTVAMNYNPPVYHNQKRCYIYSHKKWERKVLNSVENFNKLDPREEKLSIINEYLTGSSYGRV